MKKLIISTIAIAALSRSAVFARIGETYDEAVQRYGPPTGSVATDVASQGWICFAKGDFKVNVKKPDSQFSDFSDMSEVERWNFLRANCSEGWISSGSDRWTNKNLEAFYEFTKHFDTGRYYHRLYVWTDHMKSKRRAELAEKETRNQDGF